MKILLNVPRYKQPPMECGPTCLKEVFDFYNYKIDLKTIIKGTKSEKKYIDWDYKLGLFALKCGFKVDVYTLTTDIFDPTWYNFKKDVLLKQLKKRLNFVSKNNKKDVKDGYIWWWYKPALESIIKFIKAGGNIKFVPISKNLIIKLLKKGIPIIAPLNSTLIYKIRRVYRNNFDDIKGEYVGHFIVISGYDSRKDKFILVDSDRMADKRKGIIKVDADLLINSIIMHTGDLIVVKK